MFKKTIQTFATAVVLFLCAMIVLRCCYSSDRSYMTEIVADDALRQAYAAGELTVLTTHENAGEISSDGYFSAYGFVYFPECRQVQLTVRYNKSIYEYHGLPEDAVFSYTLGYEESGERFSPTSVTTEKKGIYTYSRLVFDGVELAELDLYCYMQISDSYESKHPVRYILQPLGNRSLTGGEKRLLRGEE